MPSTVVEPPPANRDVGRRPTVRSVPGPSNRSASNRCSVSRAPTSWSCRPRSRHAAAASGSSSRRSRRARSSSFASASAGASSGCTTVAHVSGRPRDDTPVRRLRVDHVEVLAKRGKLVTAARAGSTPSIRPGRCVRRDRDARAVRSPSSRSRFGYHGGTNSRVSAVAPRAPDPLDVRIEVPGVDEPRAPRVSTRPRPRGRAARRQGAAITSTCWSALDVGADLDDQLRVPPEQLPVHDRGM